MSMIEPFLPHPQRDETIAASDPGPGGPDPAPGFGIGGEEPDVAPDPDGDAGDASARAAGGDDDVPFRTPDPQDVRRTD